MWCLPQCQGRRRPCSTSRRWLRHASTAPPATPRFHPHRRQCCVSPPPAAAHLLLGSSRFDGRALVAAPLHARRPSPPTSPVPGAAAFTSTTARCGPGGPQRRPCAPPPLALVAARPRRSLQQASKIPAARPCGCGPRRGIACLTSNECRWVCRRFFLSPLLSPTWPRYRMLLSARWPCPDCDSYLSARWPCPDRDSLA